MSRKKIILAVMVVLESIILIAICYFIYKKIQEQRVKTASLYVTQIKKQDVILDTSSQFKYYYDLKPNVIEQDNPSWLRYTAKYSINADGLNARANYPIEKDSHTFRIITLGDSFTFGHYVNTVDNWPSQLEEMLNAKQKICDIKKFEIINLGMRGWDIPYITERYKEIGSKYNPDLIIWLESGSGFNRVNELMQPLIEKCDSEKIANHITFNDPQTMYSCWSDAEKEIENLYSKEQIASYLGTFMKKFLTSTTTKKILFFSFDYEGETEKNQLKTWTENFPNVSLFFTLPDLRQKNGLLPDGHPNVTGYKTIAQIIFNELKNEPVLKSCSLINP